MKPDLIHWTLAAMVMTSAAGAQIAPAQRLGPANGRSTEELSNVSGMRELGDGRLLVTESGREPRLLVLDFDNGTAELVGRKGNGPGEFQNAMRLHALGDDTTLMEAGYRRWLLLRGSQIVATVRPDDPALRVTTELRGADRRGMLLTSTGTWRDDSTSLRLVAWSTGRVSAVARLSMESEPGYPPKPAQRGDGAVVYGNYPWPTAEAALLCPDGWLAVARLNPYRIDWRTPDGQWKLGAPVPSTPVKVDTRQKQWYASRDVAAQNAVRRSNASGAWPTHIPPFESGPFGLVATPQGMLLVRRSSSAEHPAVRYDVIDRVGELRGHIILGVNEEIGLVGVRHAYVIVTDDDGIMRIRRHPWAQIGNSGSRR